MSEREGQKLSFTVSEELEGLRLDNLLAAHNPEYSRSYFQKLIKSQNVLINDAPAKASAKVKEGDEIFVNIPPPQEWHLQPEYIPLDIIYEDENVIVVNKPAGMVVHPGAGVWSGTLVHALLAHCKELSAIGGIIRPGIVHRLDKNTSGLLVAAKNDYAHRFLQEQFKERTISRTYQALVWGNVKEDKGEISGNISRSKHDRKKMAVSEEGKEALTYYRVQERFSYTTLLKINLATGRTHQIRVHMKYLHHPVFGDPEYNGRESRLKGLAGDAKKQASKLLNILPYQFLHAGRLKFILPENGRSVEFSAPLPQLLQSIINHL